MQIQPVSGSAIIAITVSMLISIGLPITLCILAVRRLKAKVPCFFIGCLTFFVSAMVLEQSLHALVLSLWGSYFTDHIFLYALYGGLAAAVFEETGRLIAMKFFMKKNLSRENALLYGIGHGGIEAILILGTAYISNLIIALQINTGAIENTLSLLDDATRQTTLEQISVLWSTPTYLFYLGGLERVLAIALHIGLSILVYKAVSSNQKHYFAVALGIHFLVDFCAVIVSNYLSVIWVEVLTFVFVAFTLFLAWKIYHAEEKTNTI